MAVTAVEATEIGDTIRGLRFGGRWGGCDECSASAGASLCDGAAGGCTETLQQAGERENNSIDVKRYTMWLTLVHTTQYGIRAMDAQTDSCAAQS